MVRDISELSHLQSVKWPRQFDKQHEFRVVLRAVRADFTTNTLSLTDHTTPHKDVSNTPLFTISPLPHVLRQFRLLKDRYGREREQEQEAEEEDIIEFLNSGINVLLSIKFRFKMVKTPQFEITQITDLNAEPQAARTLGQVHYLKMGKLVRNILENSGEIPSESNFHNVINILHRPRKVEEEEAEEDKLERALKKPKMVNEEVKSVGVVLGKTSSELSNNPMFVPPMIQDTQVAKYSVEDSVLDSILDSLSGSDNAGKGIGMDEMEDLDEYDISGMHSQSQRQSQSQSQSQSQRDKNPANQIPDSQGIFHDIVDMSDDEDSSDEVESVVVSSQVQFANEGKSSIIQSPNHSQSKTHLSVDTTTSSSSQMSSAKTQVLSTNIQVKSEGIESSTALETDTLNSDEISDEIDMDDPFAIEKALHTTTMSMDVTVTFPGYILGYTPRDPIVIGHAFGCDVPQVSEFRMYISNVPRERLETLIPEKNCLAVEFNDEESILRFVGVSDTEMAMKGWEEIQRRLKRLRRCEQRLELNLTRRRSEQAIWYRCVWRCEETLAMLLEQAGQAVQAERAERAEEAKKKR